jgi:4-amino-4-deoxy-L-arabinose transferase-like glycosyltransferase
MAEDRSRPDAPQARRLSALCAPLTLVTLAGLACRVAFVLWEPANRIAGDEITWTAWAIGAREGLSSPHVAFSPFRWEMFFYPPLYPYFMAGLHALTGTLMSVKLVQVLLSAGLIVVTGRIGTTLLGRRGGLIAAAMAAFYPELVWFSAHFWSETLFISLAWWALERLAASHRMAEGDRQGASGRPARLGQLFVCLALPAAAVRFAWGHDLELVAGAVLVGLMLLGSVALWGLSGRGSPARNAALAAGLLWGLATLTRETLLYFTPVAALWLLWRRPKDAPRRAALFMIAVVTVIAPWTYRNYVVSHAFVPIGTAGALNLWQGNTDLPRDEVYARTAAIRGPGHVGVAQYRYQRKMAWDAIRARQPWWLLEKLRSEMPAFWETDSVALIHLNDKKAYGTPTPGTARLVALIMLVPYLGVLALFALGAARLPSSRLAVLLLLFLTYYLAIHVATHGFSRYRMPVLPVVFLVAAAALTPLRDLVAARTRRLRWALASLVGIVLLISIVPSLRRQIADPAYGRPSQPATASVGGRPDPPPSPAA